jgi:hypothetical protein
MGMVFFSYVKASFMNLRICLMIDPDAGECTTIKMTNDTGNIPT